VKFALIVRFDIRKAAACFRAERGEDCSIDALTAAIFSAVLLMDLGRLVGFLGIADPVVLNFFIRFKIVFRSGTLSFGFKSNRVRNALCVAVTHSAFFEKCLDNYESMIILNMEESITPHLVYILYVFEYTLVTLVIIRMRRVFITLHRVVRQIVRTILSCLLNL